MSTWADVGCRYALGMGGTATLAVSVGTVASEACSRWQISGESAEVLRWPHFIGTFVGDQWPDDSISEVIVVYDTMSIDCVVERSPDWSEVHRGVGLLIDKGWHVTVLLALAELGPAHVALSGLETLIQGWWQLPGESLRFTSHELA